MNFPLACKGSAYLLAVLLWAGCSNQVTYNMDHTGYLDRAFTNRGTITDSTVFFKIVDSAYNALKTPGTGDLWDKYHSRYDYHFYTSKNYAAGMLYTDSMLHILGDQETKAAYLEKYAKAMFYKGDILVAQMHYNEAFDWYYRARTIIFQNSDTCAWAEYNNRLASVCFRQKKYLQAIDYYRQAFLNEEYCGRNTFQKFADQQGCLDNIGIMFSRVKNVDSAAYYYHAALAFIAANEHRFPDHAAFMPMAKAVIMGNLADVEVMRGNDTAAERLLLESIHINELADNAPEDAAYNRNKLARLYLNGGLVNKALPVIEALAIAQDTMRNPELTERLYQLRSTYAGLTGKINEAYHYLLLYNQLRDSLAVTAASTVPDVEQAFDLIHQQYQLALLNQRKTDYLWLAALFSVMALIIMVLVWKNYRRSRKNVKELMKVNEQVTRKNEHLQMALNALENSQHDNGRLLKMVAHDLRNPVGAMTSLAGLVQQGSFPPEKISDIMGVMRNSGVKAMELINDLLHVHPVESNMQLDQIDMANLMHYCVEMLHHKAQEKQQSILLQSMPALVSGDRGKLWRVFSNLISNAIKFSPKKTTISVSMAIANGEVIIKVIDQGIGIPESLHDNIFALSGTATRKGTEGEESFGLGLAISRQIVLVHHGRMWFTSVPGEETVFYVALPLMQQPESEHKPARL